MAETGIMTGGSYQNSFSNLPDQTVYSQVDLKSMNEAKYNADLRPDMHKAISASMKALSSTTGGAGTAGFAMIPIFVDPEVVDETRKYTPLVELIPRRSNMGVTADFNNITAKGGAYVAGEDAALPETNTTTDRNSVAIKYLYSVGRVTGQAIAGYPAYNLMGFQPSQGQGGQGSFANSAANNAKQLEILIKTREIRELEEELIINGSISDDANEFDGIIVQLGSTNTVDKNTTAMTLDDVDTAIKNAFDDGGRPNLSVCSSGVYTDLLNLLNAKVGFLQPVQQVFWGFSAIVLNTMVGQVPVIPSMFMSNVSGSKAIYFLDMSVVEMRVLQDLTFQELAQTNDSQKFMLKIYEALIIRNEAFCSSITEISA